MKKTSKILSIVMVFALLVTSMMISTVLVHADEDTVILNWDFKTVENDDTVKDSSGYGNDGYIGEGVTVEDGVATFTAGNAGIELPWEILSYSEDVTIEVTLTPENFGNYTTLLGVGETSGMWVVIGIMSDGSVRYAIATDGDDASESKGNSVSQEGGWTEGVVGSDIVLELGQEYNVKYVITQAETSVYVDDELALTVPTEDKDAISDLEGPVVLGKATKWLSDPSFEGTISSLKISVPAANAPALPDPEESATPAPTEEPTPSATPTPTAEPSPSADTNPGADTNLDANTNPSVSPSASPSTSATPAAGDTDGAFPWWIIVIIVVAVVVVVVVVVVVMKKKK